MSHETHDTHGTHTSENKSATPFRSAIWLVIILAGLFVAAVNFVNVMGDEKEGGEHKEATTTETMKSEGGKEAETPKAEAPAVTPSADSAHGEGH